MEGDSYYIGMKNIIMLIRMECDIDTSWVKLLRKVWPTQSVGQWVDWQTNP